MDLNGDGIKDIISGSYGGNITMYPGIEDGKFGAGVELEQALSPENRAYFMEVMFTNPTFADFNNDGLLDAFVGGIKGARVMLNVGTKTNPKFGERIDLLNVDGEKLRVFSADADPKFDSHDYKIFPIYIDWDRDGVKDLITTVSYYQYGTEPILFHKGVNVDGETRFEQGVPLIKEKDGVKVLPGMNFVPSICDYNNDGVLDLLLGVTLNYQKNEDNIDVEGGYKFLIDKEFAEISLAYREVSTQSRENPDDAELKAKSEELREKYSEYSSTLRSGDENIKSRGYVIVFPGLK